MSSRFSTTDWLTSRTATRSLASRQVPKRLLRSLKGNWRPPLSRPRSVQGSASTSRLTAGHNQFRSSKGVLRGAL